MRSATAGAAERGGQRQIAAGERLADAHHVGSDGRTIGREQRPAASEAGRDLIEDQQHAVGVAQLAQQHQVRRRVEPHAARALDDRLDDRGSELVAMACEELAQRRRVLLIECGVDAARRTRREQVGGQHGAEQVVHAVDRVAHRHRAEGVAVVSAAKTQQPRAPRARCLQAHLDRHLDRDRPGIGEEDVLQ